MILKGLIDEDIVNYQKKSMVLEFPVCKNFKCDRECGQQVCQNSALAAAPNITIDTMDLIRRYENNPITQAICMQGLEPFDTFEDLWSFIFLFRSVSQDDIVIYTGYNEDEIKEKVDLLKTQSNIIIKFGRYIPGQQPHYDELLGVNLASDNQYAEKIC
jgi:hypothetical protein